MTDRLQMDLMLDIAAFRAFGPEKLPARGQVIKKRTHLDLRPRCFTTVSHDVNLAAVDDDFRSGDGIRLACGQSKSRNAGDAEQCFAATSHHADSLQISGR